MAEAEKGRLPMPVVAELATLEPLRGCVALQTLDLSDNQLTGGLEPLRGCVALQTLELRINQLTGGLEPLRGCVALQTLWLSGNQLTPSEADQAHFEEKVAIFSI